MRSVCKIQIIVFGICLYSCGNDVKIKQMQYGDYTIKGKIEIKGGDTTFNGPIEYFDSSGNLSTVINYDNNNRNGEFIDYYNNGIVRQKAYYIDGNLHGIASFFDSSGKVIYEVNSFHGIEVGPRKTFAKDTFEVFKFTNFEGLDLYRCGWDTSQKITERGSLLNYVTNYYMDPDEDKLQLSIFIYLVNPPHKRITYKLFDKNSRTGDSTLIYKASSKDGFFQQVYFDSPKEGHSFLWSVESFYPTEMIRIENILSDSERVLKLPSARQ